MSKLSEALKRAFLKDPDGVVTLDGWSPRQHFREIKEALDAGLLEDLGDVGSDVSQYTAIAYRLTPAGKRSLAN